MLGTRSWSTFWWGAAVATAAVLAPAGAPRAAAELPAGDQLILTTETALVASPSPSVFGETVTFRASVTSIRGLPIPGGRVRFDVDGALFVANVDVASDGTAKFSTSSLSPGAHQVFAMYSGYQPSENDGLPDAQPSSTTLDHVVLAVTTTTLAASADPTTVGDAVTLTATVESEGVPANGVVEFLDGAMPLGTITLVAGRAELVTTSLSAGVHTITARYDGTAALAPSSADMTLQVNEPPPTTTDSGSSSTSSPTAPASTTTAIETSTTTVSDSSAPPPQTMPPPLASPPPTSAPTTVTGRTETTTRLVSSANPSFAGQPITFTATVVTGPSSPFGWRRGGAPRQAPPDGTLTIADDGEVLGVATLTGGRATFTTSDLSVGEHAITATFSGTATAAPSSAMIVQRIVGHATLPASR